MTSFFKRHFDLTLMTGLYTLSFGLSLLNVGVFWDDWAYIHQPLSVLVRNGYELGIPWLGYFQYLFTGSTSGVILARFVVFLSFLFSGFCLYYLLKSIQQIAPLFRLLICLFFCIFPIHYGRMLICMSHYALCFFVFFLALALTSLLFKKQSLILRFLVLLLYFFSFFTNSLLVYYGIVILLLYYHDRPRNMMRFVVRYLDFLALPIVFFLARHFLFPPHGLFDGYNQFSLTSFVYSLVWIPLSFKMSFFDVISAAFSKLPIVYLLLFGIGLYTVFPKQYLNFSWNYRIRPFLFFGIFIFILGLTPYVLVGKPPLPTGWESRHQLLLGLGGAVMLTYGLFWLSHFFKLTTHRFILVSSFVMVAFVVFNVRTQLDYHRDWAKQEALLIGLANTPQISQFSTIIFDDHTIALNAFRRRYSFYEYTHLLSVAYGGDTRMGMDSSQVALFPKLVLRQPYHEYGFQHWVPSPPQLVVTIRLSTPLPSTWQLIGDRLLFRDRYNRHIGQSLVVSMSPFTLL